MKLGHSFYSDIIGKPFPPQIYNWPCSVLLFHLAKLIQSVYFSPTTFYLFIIYLFSFFWNKIMNKRFLNNVSLDCRN